MAEYAGKGVAGTGLGLGIAGTALGVLNGGADGLLGGLLGGGNKVGQLMAENTELKANKYSDDKMLPYIVEQAKQGEQIKALEQKFGMQMEIVDGKIANAVLTTNNGLTQLQGALNCLQRTVDGISSTYVPAAKVTPLPQPNPFPPVPPYGPYLPPFPPFVPVPPVVVAPPATDAAAAGGAK